MSSKKILTIGSLDGVHLGHKALIKFMHSDKVEDSEFIFISFEPHPRLFFDNSFKILNTKEEKHSLLANDNSYVYFLDFNKELSNMSSKKFAMYIIDKFSPNTIVVGYDHHFGCDKSSGFKAFEELQQSFKFELRQFDEFKLNGQKISSTAIRNLISQGNIEKANELLGYKYSIKGEIIHGLKNGSKIGFPTANIDVINKSKLLPLKGVYITNICINDKVYNSITNIGNKPTLGSFGLSIECHIFDFDEDIYGQKVELNFEKFIREEKKFNNLEALINQIKQDVEYTKDYFSLF